MGEEAFLNAMQGLATSIVDNIGQAFGATQIKPFEGDPKEFKKWIKAIEKFALLKRVPDEKIKLVAYETSSGHASEFMHRYLSGNPGVNWETMKKELNQRFNAVNDPQHALQLLRTVKQEHGENVQIYAERLLSLAEQAVGVLEIQLVGIFTDGLHSDRVRLKVMRDNPQTMTDAIASARQEINLQMRFQLRTGRDYFSPRDTKGEPMDIDHFRVRRDRQQHKRQPRPENKPRVIHKKVLAVDEHRPRSQITCWNCHRRGHFSFECTNARVAARGADARFTPRKTTPQVAAIDEIAIYDQESQEELN